jgi:hypothetical protein
MIRRCLVGTIAVASFLVPAAAQAGGPVTLRGVVLSTRDAVIRPLQCSTSTRVGVYWTDPGRQGPPAGSGLVLSNPAAAVVGSTPSWRNGVSSVTYRIRLCGFGARLPVTEPGWYRVAVGPNEPPRAGFTVRYQGVVRLDAAPEPVRRGAAVTLTASVTDGWEYFDTHPIRFYFRRTGTTAWRYLGSATPRCIELCDIGAAAYVATRRFRQTVSGTWKAVSQRTSYLESGSAADAVASTG